MSSMNRHRFVEYARIYREFGIPRNMRPPGLLNGNDLRHALNDPLFAARSVDTVVYQKTRIPGVDGVSVRALTRIMYGKGKRGGGGLTRAERHANLAKVPTPLDVRPFQGQDVYNLRQFVGIMQKCVLSGDYKTDALLPRGWEIYWERQRSRRESTAKQQAGSSDSLAANDSISPELASELQRWTQLLSDKIDPVNSDDNLTHLLGGRAQDYQGLSAQDEALQAEELSKCDKTVDIAGYGIPYMDDKLEFSHFLKRHDKLGAIWLQERPFLGLPTIYDRCMDQYCHDLLIASMPFDYLYGSGNHAVPLRSVHTAHLAIAGHISAMTKANGKPPILLEMGLHRMRDHMPRKRVLSLMDEVLSCYQRANMRTGLTDVISALVHRSVYGDTSERVYGLTPNDALSRLLGNMYLHPLDAYLISRGHRHVRYFDRL
ncbi:hypothetical protein THASP1DRAFT_33320, partial [Thamnocephalis sphaerospora]